jgi:hypothetical protein
MLNVLFWWNLEVKTTKKNVISKGQGREVSDKNEDFMGSWTRGHTCHGVTKNVSMFCTCSLTLWETKLKGDGLLNLVE